MGFNSNRGKKWGSFPLPIGLRDHKCQSQEIIGNERFFLVVFGKKLQIFLKKKLKKKLLYYYYCALVSKLNKNEEKKQSRTSTQEI